jgi:tRNA threonylcarbamoyladenosine biosynthesis protein TsaB
MRILAIETSGHDGSLAALEAADAGQASNGAARVVSEAAITGPERTAQMLAPRLREMLDAIGWEGKSIQLVCVAVGPGSFTGLRIGVTTAKTFAYAVGAEVLGVDTLAVIADQTPKTESPLWVVMDAQRGELFAAKFVEGKMEGAPRVLTQQEWKRLLAAGDQASGPGLKRLSVELPDGVTILDPSSWQPMAAAVGQLGWREYNAGRKDDLWKMVPLYYRLSAAEEKRDKENGRQGDKETR